MGIEYWVLPDTAALECFKRSKIAVVTRETFTGTHLGALFGIPPTGRRTSWLVIDILCLVDGRIAEHWSVTDQLGALRQLGLISLPGSPGAARS